MSESPEAADVVESSVQTNSPSLPGPLRCFLGAIVAAVIAYALYNMTASIAHVFATKPVHSDNFTVRRIASAVRTLVIGLATMGTGIFSLAALGLFGLGIQVAIQRLKGDNPPSPS